MLEISEILKGQIYYRKSRPLPFSSPLDKHHNVVLFLVQFILNYNLSPKLWGPHFPKQQLFVRDRMESKMSEFEIKNFDTDNWQWVSEVAALGILQNNFEQVTPKVTEILDGKEIKTPDGILRVKK
jgi:hypothetical protein